MNRILFSCCFTIFAISAAMAQDVILRDTLPSRRAKLEAIEGKQIPSDLWPEKWNRPQPITSASLAGHPTLVVFYTDWLPESKQALETAKAFQKEFAKGDLEVLAIHHGTLQNGKVDQSNAKIPIGFDLDNKLRNYLLADADPNFYVFDRTGALAYADVSMVDLRLAVMAAVNANAIAPALPPGEAIVLPAQNGNESWSIFDILSWQEMTVALPRGVEAAPSDAIFIAPPTIRGGARERHEVTQFIATDEQLSIRARQLGEWHSDRIVRSIVDKENGLGVGRISEISIRNGFQEKRDSFVVLERRANDLLLEKEAGGWLRNPQLKNAKVQGIGHESRLPKSYSWLFELKHEVPKDAGEILPGLPYDRVQWPPVNVFPKGKYWEGVNDMQGRVPFINLDQARGLGGRQPPPLFVPGKVTVLVASSSPNARFWNRVGPRADHLRALLTKYADYIHVVSYLGGEKAIDRAEAIVPEPFHDTVILDPDNTLLKMQNLQDKGGPFLYVFSTDQTLRWMGLDGDDGTATSMGNFALLNVLLVDPAVQSERFGEIKEATLTDKEVAPDWTFAEVEHPFAELFRPTRSLELEGIGNNEKHRIKLITIDSAENRFKAKLWVVWIKIEHGHELSGRLARQQEGYEQEVDGVFDPSSNTIDIKLGKYIKEPAEKQLALTQTIHLRLDPQTKEIAGASGRIRLIVQPFSIPESVSKYRYDGRDWSKSQ